MTASNLRVGWNAWIEMLRGRFFLSRGFPTSGRIKDGNIKTYRSEVEQDGEFEQWSPKVYHDLIDNMNVLAGESSIDPPKIGENEPELPCNMSAFHSNPGSSIDGTEGIE